VKEWGLGRSKGWGGTGEGTEAGVAEAGLGQGMGMRARHVCSDSGAKDEGVDGSEVGGYSMDLDRGRVNT